MRGISISIRRFTIVLALPLLCVSGLGAVEDFVYRHADGVRGTITTGLRAKGSELVFSYANGGSVQFAEGEYHGVIMVGSQGGILGLASIDWDGDPQADDLWAWYKGGDDEDDQAFTSLPDGGVLVPNAGLSAFMSSKGSNKAPPNVGAYDITYVAERTWAGNRWHNEVVAYDQRGREFERFRSNVWKNNPSSTAGDPYGYKGPVPDVSFDLVWDHSPKFGRKLPTPKVPGMPASTMNYGTYREGLRVHGPGESEGCITVENEVLDQMSQRAASGLRQQWVQRDPRSTRGLRGVRNAQGYMEYDTDGDGRPDAVDYDRDGLIDPGVKPAAGMRQVNGSSGRGLSEAVSRSEIERMARRSGDTIRSYDRMIGRDEDGNRTETIRVETDDYVGTVTYGEKRNIGSWTPK